MRPSTRNTQTGSGMFRGSCALDFHQELGEFLFAFGLVFAGFGFSELCDIHAAEFWAAHGAEFGFLVEIVGKRFVVHGDRKSTRLNSSHGYISYAVFCLKK